MSGQSIVGRLRNTAPAVSRPKVAATMNQAADTIEALLEALQVFSDALGLLADTNVTRWPDNETIEHSGAAEEITWGDLRRARAAIASAQGGGA